MKRGELHEMLYSKKVYNISCLSNILDMQRITVSKEHHICSFANLYISSSYNLKKINNIMSDKSIVNYLIFLNKIFCSKVKCKNYGNRIINKKLSDYKFRQDTKIKVFCLRFHPS